MFTINKETAKYWAKKIPSKCPNCGVPENFTLEQKYQGFLIADTLKHKCGWELDLTAYHLV